jgi:serine/threonine protein kinase
MSERLASGESRTPAGTVPPDWPTIPGYEVLEEVGRGGMGVVFKARQVSLQRLVALKLIRDGALAGPQERGRFQIEAEAAARMRHANIVQIYEVGEHQGRPFFAMELVEGGSLEKHLAGQRWPAPQAAQLVRTLALAVQHAHEQKVVHRDLKPANILLQRKPTTEGTDDTDHTDEEGRGKHADTFPSSALSVPSVASVVDLVPKIADFGLAKRLDSASTAWTQEGAVLGTASYMAPEQAAGRVGEIGPATDVYALGAILYECLTGRPPFQADSWNRTLEQVLHDEPERLHAEVPPDLETVCLKCLEKEAPRRYASAGDLAADLGRFLEGKPVLAVPPDAAERLTRSAARDGYQLAGAIGRGPRSTTYRALYGALQQPVALKVFPAGTCTREAWEARLRRAADRWAGLAHPHLVLVQRAGWWGGAGYLAVEYVPHGSLSARLTGQPYPLREALRLVEQLAEVVRYIHRQGAVHGNLKPSNVLLAADGIPRLCDFHSTGGLFQGPLPADEAEPTGLGYLAPELVRDGGAEPRPYTDIYGLGLILYELLTGRPPFAGATAREALEQVRGQDPLPPSRLNSQVTPQLEAFCLRCLHKDPWRRYYRAYDLVTRLRYFQDNLEGRAVPGQRWARRPPGQGEQPEGPV